MENIHDNVILTLKVVIPVFVILGSGTLFIAYRWYWATPPPENEVINNMQLDIINNNRFISDLPYDLLNLWCHLDPIVQTLIFNIICSLAIFFYLNEIFISFIILF